MRVFLEFERVHAVACHGFWGEGVREVRDPAGADVEEGEVGGEVGGVVGF